MPEITIDPSVNVLGDDLVPCSHDPITGFFRNGACDTCAEDAGSHTVCAIMTAAFLDYSRSAGNDLSTPRPEFGFAGLKAGDQWCFCAARFLQAHEAGVAPKVSLRGTHRRALDVVPIDILRAYSAEQT